MDKLKSILTFDKVAADPNSLLSAISELAETKEGPLTTSCLGPGCSTGDDVDSTDGQEGIDDLLVDTLHMNTSDIIAELNIDLAEMDPADTSGLFDFAQSTLSALMPSPAAIGRYAAIREKLKRWHLNPDVPTVESLHYKAFEARLLNRHEEAMVKQKRASCTAKPCEHQHCTQLTFNIDGFCCEHTSEEEAKYLTAYLDRVGIEEPTAMVGTLDSLSPLGKVSICTISYHIVTHYYYSIRHWCINIIMCLYSLFRPY